MHFHGDTPAFPVVELPTAAVVPPPRSVSLLRRLTAGPRRPSSTFLLSLVPLHRRAGEAGHGGATQICPRDNGGREGDGHASRGGRGRPTG
jgi:hypothetical protein